MGPLVLRRLSVEIKADAIWQARVGCRAVVGADDLNEKAVVFRRECTDIKVIGGRSSVGRAQDCDSCGRGFEPLRPPQYTNCAPELLLFYAGYSNICHLLS